MRVGWKGEGMEGLRNREKLDVWHHRGLEYRPNGPSSLVQHSVRRWLQVYGRVAEERRTDVETRQRKREAEEAHKVEVAPEVTVGSLRRFRAALIGSTQRLPKRVGCSDREA